jgi:putative addiction module component (TIGR02574 family)
VTQEANELLRKALTLPPEDRAALAGSLIESLETTTDSFAEQAWSEEIAHRIQDLDSGKAKTVPWEEVRRRISIKLGDGQ